MPSIVFGSSVLDIFYFYTPITVAPSSCTFALSIIVTMAVVNTIEKIRADLAGEGANLIWLTERAETDLRAIQTEPTPIISYVGPTAPIGVDPVSYMVYRPSDLPIQLLEDFDSRHLRVVWFGCNNALDFSG